MLKKTISYTDYNDIPRVEDFYFNLTEAELTDMELSVVGGLEAMLKKIIDTKDVPSIVKIFKELICKSYGEKSADGRRFMKEDADGHPLYVNFTQTEAYSKLYMELATDADAAAAFVNGIMPKNIASQVNKAEVQKLLNN